MLLGTGPTRLHLDHFFIKRDCDLVIAFVKRFFSFVHHPFCFRIVGGLEEALERIVIDAAHVIRAQISTGDWRWGG